MNINVASTKKTPPIPFTPIFLAHEDDLFILSNETEIPDLSQFIDFKGSAIPAQLNEHNNIFTVFQKQWEQTEAYKRFPYRFENLLKIRISKNPDDWITNRIFLDREMGYHRRVRYIGQNIEAEMKLHSQVNTMKWWQRIFVFLSR